MGLLTRVYFVVMLITAGVSGHCIDLLESVLLVVAIIEIYGSIFLQVYLCGFS